MTGRRCIVTRLDKGNSIVDVTTHRVPLADLSIGNLGWILERLQAREEIWRSTFEALPDPEDACEWSLSFMMYDLPQGCRSVARVFDRLTDAEARVWLIPRSLMPDIERATAAAAAVLAIRERHRRGECLDATDVATAIGGLEELILLKRRIEHAHQCVEEFQFLAELAMADDPPRALAYAQQAVGCARRQGNPATVAEARALTDEARRRLRLRTSTVRGSRRAHRPDPGSAEPDGAHAEDVGLLFSLSRGREGASPLGPFENLGGGPPRTGMQHLMDAEADVSPTGQFAIWTEEGGRWVADRMDDRSAALLCAARSSMRNAGSEPIHTDHVRRAIWEAVAALEAFVNLASYFVHLEGPGAWPAAGLNEIFADFAAFERRPRLHKKIEYLGDGLFGSGWLPVDTRNDLLSLLTIRNDVTHQKVGRTEPLVAPSEKAAGKPSATPRSIPGSPTLEWGSRAVEIVEATLGAFRSAYARTYGIPPRDRNLPRVHALVR